MAPVTPPPQLGRPERQTPSEAAKQAQVIIDRASKAIQSTESTRTFPRSDSRSTKALSLLAQAEEALKKSDFENAKKLAEKVEDDREGAWEAAELTGRKRELS